jgi:hypothetical protein
MVLQPFSSSIRPAQCQKKQKARRVHRQAWRTICILAVTIQLGASSDAQRIFAVSKARGTHVLKSNTEVPRTKLTAKKTKQMNRDSN